MPKPKHTAANLFAYSLFAVALCFVLQTSPSPGWAGEVFQVIPVDFGVVDINPSGCVIAIDARSGETTPVASKAVAYGGRSGKLSVRSQVEEQLHVEYPASITLFSPSGTITIGEIQTLSQFNNQFIHLEGNGIPIDIHIGGSLTLQGDEPVDSYSGTLKVELTFNVL